MSEQRQHTPGPWFLAYSDNATPHILTKDMRFTHHYDDDEVRDALVCIMPAEITKSFNSIANARLIAAAPELLDALEMVRDADEDCKRDGLPTIPKAARSKIDAAIAAAGGEA